MTFSLNINTCQLKFSHQTKCCSTTYKGKEKSIGYIQCCFIFLIAKKKNYNTFHPPTIEIILFLGERVREGKYCNMNAQSIPLSPNQQYNLEINCAENCSKSMNYIINKES